MQSQNLQWVKQIGNSTGDFFALSSVTDATGNIYTTGSVDGTIDFDPGEATALLTDSGFGDIFISKIDSGGNFEWAKQIGRESYDQGSSIALDAAGNIYVCGFFSLDSTDFDPGTGIQYLPNPGFGPLTYILKLDPSGNLIWAKELEPSRNVPSSITLDASGNILLTGIFDGTVDFDPGDGVYNLSSASSDICILKLDASGNFIWAKRIDINTTLTKSNSIATDVAENIYISGLLVGTVDFDPGAGISNLTATSIFGAEFILKLDASGIFSWAKVINGSISPTGGDRSIRVDDAGNSFTSGWFGGTVDFDPNTGVFNLVNTVTTGSSTYLLKLNSTGNLVWAKQIGDPGNGNYRALTLDASFNLYVAGMINSTGDFDPGIGTDTLSTANGRAFVAKYDGNGSLIWAVNFSNDIAGSDASVTLNVDASGNVISTGTFHNTSDFDPGSGIFNLTSNADEDVFIHKLNQNTALAVNDLKYEQNNLSVYPNPSNGTFSIETKNKGAYSIFNEAGQILRSFTVNTTTTNKTTISGLSNGIYFVFGVNNGKIEGNKILVQNQRTIN